MLGSTVVEIDGVFLGVAIIVNQTGTRRFYAAHDCVRSLHNKTIPDIDLLKQQVASQARLALPVVTKSEK
ncbi:hypothetical protein [Swingsia samuiensis]|uniref:Uncharacterized protein n=1 Tax=Swingsia samuiensis TaxID=1293412 RepID=A0A4Y6UI23_9PROT|nr:hypothetical protein [Swingsia samuiensis]QDH16694.1 hypothetical protein E3D00_03215 [Swingsia samuiensis]